VGSTGAGEMDIAPDQAEHVVKGMVLLFEIDERRCGKAPCPELFSGINGECRQAFSILIAIGIEQSTVDDTKNGRSGAYAEGEWERCSHSEAGGLTKLADRVSL